MTGFDETVPPDDDENADENAAPIEDPEIRSGHIGTDDPTPRDDNKAEADPRSD